MAGVLVIDRMRNVESGGMLFWCLSFNRSTNNKQHRQPTTNLSPHPVCKTANPTMMTCRHILTKRIAATLPQKGIKAVTFKEFSALVSIEDEFPGYVKSGRTALLVAYCILYIIRHFANQNYLLTS